MTPPIHLPHMVIPGGAGLFPQTYPLCNASDPGLAGLERVGVELRSGDPWAVFGPAGSLYAGQRNPTGDEAAHIASNLAATGAHVCVGTPEAGAGGTSYPVYSYRSDAILAHTCAPSGSGTLGLFRPLSTHLNPAEAQTLVRLGGFANDQYCLASDPTDPAHGITLMLQPDSAQIRILIERLTGFPAAHVSATGGLEVRSATPHLESGRALTIAQSLQGMIGDGLRLDDIEHHMAQQTQINQSVLERLEHLSANQTQSQWLGGGLGLTLILGILTLLYYFERVRLQSHQAGAFMPGERLLTRASNKVREMMGRDMSSGDFVTDLKTQAMTGELRPAFARRAHIESFRDNFHKDEEYKRIPTIIADSGEGKSRFVEAIGREIFHDREGNLYTSPNYNPANRSIPEFDPAKTHVFSLALNVLHEDVSNARRRWLKFTDLVDDINKRGGQVLIIIDEIQTMYGSDAGAQGNQPNTAHSNLIARIRNWIDHKLKNNRNVRVIGATTTHDYRRYMYDFEDHANTHWGSPTVGRRFPHWILPPFRGDQLREVLNEVAESWEEKYAMELTEEARARVMFLSRHPRLRSDNLDAVLNLLDDARARASKMKLANSSFDGRVTPDFVNRVFADRHGLPLQEVQTWTGPTNGNGTNGGGNGTNGHATIPPPPAAPASIPPMAAKPTPAPAPMYDPSQVTIANIEEEVRERYPELASERYSGIVLALASEVHEDWERTDTGRIQNGGRAGLIPEESFLEAAVERLYKSLTERNRRMLADAIRASDRGRRAERAEPRAERVSEALPRITAGASRH